MQNIILELILAAIVGMAIYGTVKRIRFGSDCCGRKEPAPKKLRVADKNKNNYPYIYNLTVDGMHCINCARRIENAFNKTEGNWAAANLGNKQVVLRAKTEKTPSELAGIVSSEGYTLIEVH